ncbi:MAG: hypothetical protein ACOZQL_17895 [Myxococcota bacterium]
MTRRRFASTAAAPVQSAAPTLGARLGAERLPLDLALSLAVELVEVVARTHQQRLVFGRLSADDVRVDADGSLSISVATRPGVETSVDTQAVGEVLFQLFTGVTPAQARARLRVPSLHETPAASLLNPALDEALAGVLAQMLDRNPARRPHSLRVVEGVLADVCEQLELEPSRAQLLRWAKLAPKLQVVAPPARHTPTVVFRDDEEDELEDLDDDAPAPRVGFDGWTLAACGFCVVAFAMATSL